MERSLATRAEHKILYKLIFNPKYSTVFIFNCFIFLNCLLNEKVNNFTNNFVLHFLRRKFQNAKKSQAQLCLDFGPPNKGSLYNTNEMSN